MFLYHFVRNSLVVLRETPCARYKLQAVGMSVEVVGKEQQIADCRQFECQLKL